VFKSLAFLFLSPSVQGESYEKAAAALAQVVAQPDWRISADAAGPVPQDKKKPHNDVEAIIAEATKQRRKLLNADSSSSSSSDEGDEEENGEEPQTGDEDETEPELKKTKKEADKSKAKVEEPSAPLVIGIEEAGMHIVLKKILKNDGKREGHPFSQKLLQSLSTDVVSTCISYTDQ